MNIKKNIKNIIYNALKNMKIEVDLNDIVIEIPKNKNNGDFSTNIALKLCKIAKKNPIEFANEIKETIEDDMIENIEVANTGFINFYLNKKYIFSKVNEINKLNDDYGKSTIGNNEKINVEYVSANPTGILHIGHGRGATYGDNLARIMNFSGYDVTKEYYLIN